MKRLFCPIFISFFYFQSSCSQITSNLTINDGLSQNYVYDILQDQRGFVWFGTKEGLNRYDGYSFVVYRNDQLDPHSLSDNTITALHEDSTGILWVGTLTGILNKYDNKTETFIRFVLNSSSDKFERINSISSGSNGVLWICTHGGGLIQFHTKTGEVNRFMPDTLAKEVSLKSSFIFDAVEDDSVVLIATNISISSLNLRTHKINNFRHPTASKSENLSTIYKTSRGVVLVAYRNGVDIFDGKKFKNFYTANTSNKLYRTSRIKEDRAGNLWFVTGQRILKYDLKKKQLSSVFSIEGEHFTRGLYIDASNVVWCGTSGLGVYISNQKTIKFGKNEGSYLFELFPKEIILAEEYLKRKNVYAEAALLLRGDLFPSCIKDCLGNIWLLSTQGLLMFEKESGQARQISTNPRQYKRMPTWNTSRLFEDRAGNIWIGTVGGISKLNRTVFKFDYYRLYPDTKISNIDLNQSSYKDISAIYQDRNGIFWIGTPTLGLIKFNPVDNQIKYFLNQIGDATSISNNYVLSICEDPYKPDSVLWIGTDGGGLNQFYIQTEKFKSFTTANNFPNNVVYGILSDQNKFLWISTNYGLIKMNPQNYKFKQYDIHDGLQSNEFNRNEYYKTADGKMYFGGVYGYNVFRPEEVLDNSIIPNVAITKFSIFNKTVTHQTKYSPLEVSITETKSITLDYSQNMFTFEFSALEFSASPKNHYAYKLIGFDDNWNYVGTDRKATYTNLHPGEYKFCVKASNGDGIWNDNGTSIAVIILPPFYMTWWFRTITILGFITTVLTFTYFRIKQLTRERNQQEELSKLLIQNQEKERKRIAQDIHDILGQEMLVIKNRALMGLKTAKEESRERKQLEHISLSSSNILMIIREISHNLRPPELDRLGLTETLRAIVGNIRESSSFALGWDIEELDGLINKEDEINVVRIIQEALSNIIKYAEAKDVFVEVKRENKLIAIRIKDDGKGFKIDKIKPGMGLPGIAERVRILHGTITMQSEYEKGTTISINIPINGKTE